MMCPPTIGVVIPAYNASDTIGMAIASALAQPEVNQIVLVDDASTDNTSEIAQMAADGDDRLLILRQKENIGPAKARNFAFARVTADFVSLLDADDYFLPNRFQGFFDHGKWDIFADNIVFVPESTDEPITSHDVPIPTTPSYKEIDLNSFILGNIPDAKIKRGELGFLKPVISCEFLNRTGLCYDPSLRLGEDFRFYMEALICGARFIVTPTVGYVAQVRPDSLSGHHSALDLRNLLDTSLDLQSRLNGDPKVDQAMQRYLTALRNRYLLRDFLEFKRRFGTGRAALRAIAAPAGLYPIAKGIARDKLQAISGKKPASPSSKRFLVPID